MTFHHVFEIAHAVQFQGGWGRFSRNSFLCEIFIVFHWRTDGLHLYVDFYKRAQGDDISPAYSIYTYDILLFLSIKSFREIESFV